MTFGPWRRALRLPTSGPGAVATCSWPRRPPAWRRRRRAHPRRSGTFAPRAGGGPRQRLHRPSPPGGQGSRRVPSSPPLRPVGADRRWGATAASTPPKGPARACPSGRPPCAPGHAHLHAGPAVESTAAAGSEPHPAHRATASGGPVADQSRRGERAPTPGVGCPEVRARASREQLPCWPWLPREAQTRGLRRYPPHPSRFRLSVSRERGGKPKLLLDSATAQIGDQLGFEVTLPQASPLLLLSISADGTVTPHFPTKVGEAGTVEAGTSSLPVTLTPNGNPGIDRFIALACAKGMSVSDASTLAMGVPESGKVPPMYPGCHQSVVRLRKLL